MRNARSHFETLRRFAEFWADHGDKTPCCKFAKAEDIEQDPQMYQCGTCDVKKQIDGLDAEGQEAWQMYQQVCSRFTLETHTAGVVLERATAGMDDDAALDVVARLSLIYGVLCPQKRLPSWRVN